MLIKLIFAIVILYFLFKWIYKFKTTPAANQKQKLIQLGLILVAGALAFGVLTGKMHWIGAVFAGALPFLRRGIMTIMNIAPFWLRKTGGKAHFKTEHLDLEVNIQNRTIAGEVTQGPHAGRRIEQLSAQELAELAEYYQERDKKSYYFIRAAQKGFAYQTDQNGQSEQKARFSDPDRQEALSILGLEGDPTRDDVIKAHRRLINKLHPDRGGSDFLASRVNQARDVLLKNLER